MDRLTDSFRVMRGTSIGFLLVIVGIAVLYFGNRGTGQQLAILDYGALFLGGFLTLAGVFFMFRELSFGSAVVVASSSRDAPEDADYVVHQLSRNFEILRAQTNQGFLLSGVFMAVGLVIITASLFAPTLNIQTQGVDRLGVLAGVVTEFISGTALLLYRLNFTRLNETSDRLDDAWRVLAAFKLTGELPDDKKAEATIQLIATLTRKRGPEALTIRAGPSDQS